MNYFIIYEDCCFYEIVILNYFMKFTNQELSFCTPGGKSITCMEGFRVAADRSIDEIELSKAKSIILTGGNIKHVKSEKVTKLLQEANEKGILIGAICAGVDILEEAGLLQGINSTHSTEE
jgi:transcriptional regulator GlxA family with amidase domain